MKKKTRREFLKTTGAVVAGAGLSSILPGRLGLGSSNASTKQPNILLALSDDQSWPHTGIMGDPVVRTPVFDRVAREGVLFRNAFCAAPTCSPSRAALLTGQDIWRLGPAADLAGPLDGKYAVYPDILEARGYYAGYTGKGWAPGIIGECRRKRNPAGREYNGRGVKNYVENFRAFLDARPKHRPFCFWFGSHDPHQPYVPGSGRGAGLDIDKVPVPTHLPDLFEVRDHMLDYYFAIERFDRNVGEMLALLEERGLLANTVVVITSDNGMDFPRSKATLYDWGTHVPLAVSWPGHFPGGRSVDDFVNLSDFAPTFVELARERAPRDMTGRSLLEILRSDRSGLVDPRRTSVYLARERHAPYRAGGVGYPMRAIRDADFLYIRNYNPDRWPAGDPPYFADPPGNYPPQQAILKERDTPMGRRLFELCYGKRPADELYDLKRDPDQLRNVAAMEGYEEDRVRLLAQLDTHLGKTGDPRALGGDGGWDGVRWPLPWQYPEFKPR